MVTETVAVIEECEEYCSTSDTRTSTTMKCIKQNGANSIVVENNVLNNGSASVMNDSSRPAQEDQTYAIGSSELEVKKSCVQPLSSTENTCFLDGKCYD